MEYTIALIASNTPKYVMPFFQQKRWSTYSSCQVMHFHCFCCNKWKNTMIHVNRLSISMPLSPLHDNKMIPCNSEWQEMTLRNRSFRCQRSIHSWIRRCLLKVVAVVRLFRYHITWGASQYKYANMPSYQQRDSHVKDKTVLTLTWESPYLGETIFILLRGPGY